MATGECEVGVGEAGFRRVGKAGVGCRAHALPCGFDLGFEEQVQTICRQRE